jgi:hypothetical protein
MGKIDWPLFWTAVGAVAASLTLLGGLFAWLFKSLKKQAQRELDEARAENLRLREDLQARLQVPTFGLEAVRLTEIAAERKITEIESRYRAAIEAKDHPLAEELRTHKAQIQELRRKLEDVETDRQQLQLKLQSAVSAEEPPITDNAVGLRSGTILVIRRDGKYGAVQAIDQASDKRGAFIRYAWWFQPDGSAQFTSPSTQTGVGETRESYPGAAPFLQVGPIQLEWSMGGDGFGWVYYQGAIPKPGAPSALAPTNESDITKVDVKHLRFYMAGNAA